MISKGSEGVTNGKAILKFFSLRPTAVPQELK
jgi:hypothetical protein